LNNFFHLKYKNSVLVFFKTPNMNTRFLNCLKIYSINSLLTHLNDLIAVTILFSVNHQVWLLNDLLYFDNNFTMVYYVYVYLPLWVIFYAFEGNYICFLNSKPNLKSLYFLFNYYIKGAWTYTFLMVAFKCFTPN